MKTFTCEYCRQKTTRTLKYWRGRRAEFIPRKPQCVECGKRNMKGMYA